VNLVETQDGCDEDNTRAKSLSPLLGDNSHERENARHRATSRVSGCGTEYSRYRNSENKGESERKSRKTDGPKNHKTSEVIGYRESEKLKMEEV
jgi:hypothetical protein